jgi:uncharacterized membrane protein HdeD (DUF308 family)
MNRSYSNFWWVYFIRGIFAILFGITTFILPATAFSTLVVFFALFMIGDGSFSILFSLNTRRPIRNRPWLLFLGMTGIIAGALMLFNPFISAVTLISLFAFWSFFAGIIEMIRAMSAGTAKKREGWYVVSGILAVLVVVLLLTDPVSGNLSLGMIFGTYALLIGISLVSLSFKLRRQLRSGLLNRAANQAGSRQSIVMNRPGDNQLIQGRHAR